MRMPFGMHKGTDVQSLPRDYLLWLTENVPLRPPLSVAVADALALVERSEPVTAVDPGRVQRVYRRLSKRFHPDCGGSHDAMIALTAFYEGLTVACT